MDILIINIRELVQVETQPVLKRSGSEMKEVITVRDAFLHISGGRIKAFGSMQTLGRDLLPPERGRKKVIDATGKMVLPCFCDPHTHVVFPASREAEFVDKIKGLSYEEIAARGGGILNSAGRMKKAAAEELYIAAMERLREVTSLGTGAIEIKSGYGLDTENELKMLRVIKRLREASPMTIRATFLGAHAVPLQYKHDPRQYVDMVINEMIPQVAAGDLADYIDVFCDRGFFTVEDTERILMAGIKHGLIPKIHANELDYSGGVQTGVKYGALSVDHLEYSGTEEIEALKYSETIPTILPGAAFFLGLPLAPARSMIEAGLPVAMASDYNPGSSPSGNMQFIFSLACIAYRLLPEEALNAVTLNSACAMGVSDELGTIAVGKKANVFITRPIPSWHYMPYAFGTNKVETVILNGRIQ
jgi:imidazolonepropionase